MPTGSGTKQGRPGQLTSSAAMLLGVAAPIAAVAGAYLANTGRLPPEAGFRLFGLSLPLAVLAILFAIVALFRARGGRNRSGGRKALTGVTFSIVTISAVVGLALPTLNYPLINDITTDTDDPPAFVAVARLEANRSEDMSYPAGFAEQQKRAYPTLASKVLSVPPEQAFERARAALESLPNTRVIDASVEEGRVEAISVSSAFHFVDDVVLRIRPTPGGSRIDIRSRSRVGKGDLGANAHRIETLLTVLH